MAGTAAQAIAKVKSWHGLKEGAQADAKIVKPWGKWTGNKKASSKKNPWCQITCSQCLHSVSVGTSASAGCTQAMKWYKARKRWKANGSTPKAGWQVFYHFKKKKWDKKLKKYVYYRSKYPGHTGVCISVNTKTGYMKVEEGNKQNKVGTRTIKYKSADVLGFGIPPYK